MKILIKNGRVIDPASDLDEVCDVAIAAGRIARHRQRRRRLRAEQDASTRRGCIVAPGLVDLAARLREPGHEHEGMLESEMAAAVAGGVTSLVCPPDTDPVLDEPGLVEMLKFRAEKLHQARVFPLGALTRNLQGEMLTEMVELTEAGCVGFSQAEVPLAQHAGAAARAAVRRDLRLHRVAASAGAAPGQGRGRQRPAGHAPGPVRRAGGGRDDRAAHDLRTDASHRRARAPVPLSAARPAWRWCARPRREGLPVTCDVSINSLHLTDVDIGYFDSRMRLNPPLRQQRDRDALRAGAGRRHDRRAGVRPHAGRRRRQDAAVRRGRARRHRPRAAAGPGAQVGPGKRRGPGARARGAHQRAGAGAGRGAGHLAGQRRADWSKAASPTSACSTRRPNGRSTPASLRSQGKHTPFCRLRAAGPRALHASSAGQIAFEGRDRAWPGA